MCNMSVNGRLMTVGPGFNLNTRSPWSGHWNVAVELE